MLNKILNALKAHNELAGWSVREIHTLGSQLYAVPKAVEAARRVDDEKYKVNVFSQGAAADGSTTMGRGDVTILPGGDIEQAIAQASLVAGLVSNPLYSLPDVELVDPEVKADPEAAMQALLEQIRRAGAATKGVRLTAAECFGDVIHTRLVNSRGIDVEQEETLVSAEFNLMAGKTGSEVESFAEMTRRRPRDLRIEEAIEERARLTADLLGAGAAPAWQGPVVIRNQTLAGFMSGDDLAGGVLQFLADAGSKYAKVSSWEIGQPVFRGEVKGDPFTMWANRALPFGSSSNRFDGEGLPAGRVGIVRDNVLVNFAASQKYADYMGLPATGDFGNVELPPGPTSAEELLKGPYVEVVQFSWFNPDAITGDFATEIRLGYLVENGVRKPFKGGQLIGNYMDALGNVCWSSETRFFGTYLGPNTARFNDLKIAA
jgi:predicted Zn-dependent protease